MDSGSPNEGLLVGSSLLWSAGLVGAGRGAFLGLGWQASLGRTDTDGACPTEALGNSCRDKAMHAEGCLLQLVFHAHSLVTQSHEFLDHSIRFLDDCITC
jgi:hypothetical protein